VACLEHRGHASRPQQRVVVGVLRQAFDGRCIRRIPRNRLHVGGRLARFERGQRREFRTRDIVQDDGKPEVLDPVQRGLQFVDGVVFPWY